ncbi:MAG: hypothetical protein IPK00_22255 [Deltaproteobacteria bacterium]|nr:hypothetical protein [Deltaproteobacteria bacterium]
MLRRRSLAVLALMVVLTIAPSLAWAASVCASQCCPAMLASGPGGADSAAEDCRGGFANRSCCSESAAPVPLPSPTLSDAPALPARLPALEPVAAASLRAPSGRADAHRALRASPLRLSVVLLI